jgi:hypothetical protein
LAKGIPVSQRPVLSVGETGSVNGRMVGSPGAAQSQGFHERQRLFVQINFLGLNKSSSSFYQVSTIRNRPKKCVDIQQYFYPIWSPARWHFQQVGFFRIPGRLPQTSRQHVTSLFSSVFFPKLWKTSIPQ